MAPHLRIPILLFSIIASVALGICRSTGLQTSTASTSFSCFLKLAGSTSQRPVLHNIMARLFGEASFTPSSHHLSWRLTDTILIWVDRHGGEGRSRRTALSAHSDGRSLSPGKCFQVSRDETLGDPAICWDHFSFDSTTSAVVQRLENCLCCTPGQRLLKYKIGVSRYLKRRFCGDDTFGAPHYPQYETMCVLAFASLGICCLEDSCIQFCRYHGEIQQKLQNIASGGGGFCVEKPGWLHCVYTKVSEVAEVADASGPAQPGACNTAAQPAIRRPTAQVVQPAQPAISGSAGSTGLTGNLQQGCSTGSTGKHLLNHPQNPHLHHVHHVQPVQPGGPVAPIRPVRSSRPVAQPAQPAQPARCVRPRVTASMLLGDSDSSDGERRARVSFRMLVGAEASEASDSE